MILFDYSELQANDILEFKNDYAWLSNMRPCIIELDGLTYPTSEHAYVALKSDDMAWRRYCTLDLPPKQIKREGRNIKIVSNWDEVKHHEMAKVLCKKYLTEPYKSLLLNLRTDILIVEGNRWNDMHWGFCLKTYKGLNWLGSIIMLIKSHLHVNSNYNFESLYNLVLSDIIYLEIANAE